MNIELQTPKGNALYIDFKSGIATFPEGDIRGMFLGPFEMPKALQTEEVLNLQALWYISINNVVIALTEAEKDKFIESQARYKQLAIEEYQAILDTYVKGLSELRDAHKKDASQATITRLEKKYPRAALYLLAEEYSKPTNSFPKRIVGYDAMEKLEDGESTDTVEKLLKGFVEPKVKEEE